MSSDELVQALQKLPNTALGPDSVTAKVVKFIGRDHDGVLFLQLITRCKMLGFMNPEKYQE